jgi:DinB superfamily
MLLNHLHTTRSTFLAAIEGLSDAQWRFAPPGGGWSIAQITEHVTRVERALVRMLTERLPHAPAPSSPYTPEQRRARLLRVVPDRRRRVTSSDRVQPGAHGPALADARDAFLAVRAQVIALAGRPDPAFAEHVLPHPVLGDLDGHEWLLFTSLHLERHVGQIDEVKQTPGFPA